jgi:hypothetical protein
VNSACPRCKTELDDDEMQECPEGRCFACQEKWIAGTFTNTLGNYYVTVVDGARVGLLAGPYPNQGVASRQVNHAKRIACEHNSWAHWYAYGVSRVKSQKPGRLNRAGLI